MRKITGILIFICCLFPALAETGYNGIEWGRRKSDIDFNGFETTIELSTKENIVSFGSIALGDNTIKSFIFENDKLKGACYLLSAKSLPELLSKLDNKKKVLEIETELNSEDEIFDFMLNQKNEGVIFPYNMDTDDGVYSCFIAFSEYSAVRLGNYTEENGYKNIEKAKKKIAGVGTLYIYDYNDDTRIYITTGNIKNFAFVAYVPHYKDY